MMTLDEAIKHCEEKSCKNTICAQEHKQLAMWLTELKKLKKEKYKTRGDNELKNAWSEEDEKMIHFMIEYLERLNRPTGNSCIKWLKSLKERYTWKPNKEQIIALRWVLNNVPYNKHKEEISGLLDQIKEIWEYKDEETMKRARRKKKEVL